MRLWILKSRWVFAFTLADDGTILKVKARFVACGYSQIENMDYDKIYAATLPGCFDSCLGWVIVVDCLRASTTDALSHCRTLMTREGGGGAGAG